MKIKAWLASFPSAAALPFVLRPAELYSPMDLYDGYVQGDIGSWEKTYDHRNAAWFFDKLMKRPRRLTTAEAVAARLHDAAIERAVDSFLSSSPKTVGFMGGTRRFPPRSCVQAGRGNGALIGDAPA